ncbi:MAG: polysaccharide deacetylase family protein [Rubrivivax sp.]|nr:polysaccharide deacetylase family protein [Rubrivivax sp.]
MLIRTVTGLLSPQGPRAKLSVLIFHRVHAEVDPLFPDEPDAVRFSAIVGWLKRWFCVLPLDAAVRALRDRRLPARALSITFDDGYADNHDVALPVLAQHGVSATFFIATGFVGGGRMWNDTVVESVRRTRHAELDLDGLRVPGLSGRLTLDGLPARRSALTDLLKVVKYLEPVQRRQVVDTLAQGMGAELPDDLMMSVDQLRRMRAAGMGLGAHTVSHPILAKLDRADARREIDDSRRFLQEALGERVGLFAYPNGKPGADYSSETVDVVRGLGFDAAVSTAPGTLGRGGDLLQIPRFTPWRRERTAFGASLLRNLI